MANASNGSGGSGGGNPPENIHTWLERFNKQKSRSFSVVTSPDDAEHWIAHMEKIFEGNLYGIHEEVCSSSWGFLGDKAGTPGEQAKKFEWALKKDLLDGVVNMHFDDVAGVANAVRNIGIAEERAKRGVKRNYDGERERRVDTCKTCGKSHPGRQCHRISRACFNCSQTGHMARDCPKPLRYNQGVGRDRPPATTGRVHAADA
ncbi:hypothetical protein CTI12_AA327640 [Artemisia annua]|uniref:CCHC-type domain-containing protein n=1 Tax=Artemisia annua TaxID=35608 RepID=A0A2U1MYS5_ARTAN|nr:hypothetical protein CTI12_AA327640 [Artemisia annua]